MYVLGQGSLKGKMVQLWNRVFKWIDKSIQDKVEVPSALCSRDVDTQNHVQMKVCVSSSIIGNSGIGTLD